MSNKNEFKVRVSSRKDAIEIKELQDTLLLDKYKGAGVNDIRTEALLVGLKIMAKTEREKNVEVEIFKTLSRIENSIHEVGVKNNFVVETISRDVEEQINERAIERSLSKNKGIWKLFEKLKSRDKDEIIEKTNIKPKKEKKKKKVVKIEEEIEKDHDVGEI